MERTPATGGHTTNWNASLTLLTELSGPCFFPPALVGLFWGRYRRPLLAITTSDRAPWSAARHAFDHKQIEAAGRSVILRGSDHNKGLTLRGLSVFLLAAGIAPIDRRPNQMFVC